MSTPNAHRSLSQSKAISRCRTACLQCRSQKIRCIRSDEGCLSCIRAGKDCSLTLMGAGYLDSLSVEGLAICKSGSPSLRVDLGLGGFGDNQQNSSSILYHHFRAQAMQAFYTTQGPSAKKRKVEVAGQSSNESVSPSVVRPLADQGCFDLPRQEALDQLFRHYFWHVHPLYPILDEVSFWRMHRSTSTVDLVTEGKLSLFVLYGILYTSSSYASVGLMEAIGFPTIHQATSTFYQRGKTIYESGLEKSPIAKAQGSLLLSHCYLTQPPHSLLCESETWLRMGIQHVKESGAHKYHLIPSPAPPEIETLRKTLKRLLWACFLRDCVMSLAGRKDLQMPRSMLDLDTHAPLGVADLAEEIPNSDVYSSSVKKTLVDIVAKLVELCIILTDVCSVSAYAGPDGGYTLAQQAEHASRIRTCRTALGQWHDSMMRLRLDSREMHPYGSEMSSDAAVVVFTNVLLIYYHAANLALCHQEMIILGIDSDSLSSFHPIMDQIQSSNAELIQCLVQVVQLRLAHWLPLGAAACVIVPLALQIVDLKLLSMAPNHRSPLGSEAVMLKERQTCFARLIEAMEMCRSRFLAVDWLLNCVRVSAESFHQLLCSQACNRDANGRLLPSQSWAEIFKRQPRFYLSLVALMDFSVHVGELPAATDLSMHWSAIGRPKAVAAKATQSDVVSESLSLGDLEILAHIEEHCMNLWDSSEESSPDYIPESQGFGGPSTGSSGEHVENYDVNGNDPMQQTLLDLESSAPAFIADKMAGMPRRWMEEISVLSY